MANRIIIENRTTLTDTAALLLVADIIENNKNEDQGTTRRYPIHTRYAKRYDFRTTRNKRSDRFLLTDLDPLTVEPAQ